MKIVKSEGCTAWYTEIDGKRLEDFLPFEKEDIVRRLIENVSNLVLDDIINSLIEHYTPRSTKTIHCDQCNDYNEINTYEI